MTIKYQKRNWQGNLDSIFMYDDADATINLSIPIDEANTDYQEFLQWKADGGVPDEAD